MMKLAIAACLTAALWALAPGLAMAATSSPADAGASKTSDGASAPASDPADQERLALLIAVIRDSKDPATATAAYSRAAYINERSPELNLAYTRRMLQFGVPSRAQNAATLLTRADAGNALGWAVMGFIQARSGQNEQALASFAKAMELDASNPSVQSGLGQLLAWADAQKGQPALQGALKQSVADHRAQWLKQEKFANAYGAMTDLIKKLNEDDVKKSADLQGEIDTLKDKLRNLDIVYGTLKDELNHLQKVLNSLMSGTEDDNGNTVIDRGAVRDQKFAIQKCGDRVAEAEKAGKAAAAEFKAKNDALAKLKAHPSSQSASQQARFDPPAVDGVVTAEAAVTSAPTSAPVLPEDPEFDAQQALRLGKLYVGNKMSANAETILREIIQKYPKTKAAAEAQQLLKDLPATPAAP